MIGIGAAAVVAVGAFLVVLLSPASQSPVQTTDRLTASGGPTTTESSAVSGVPTAAQTAAKSIVQLQATTTHGTVTLIGVAVAEGGMVVTTASLLSGVERIDLVRTDGTLQRASIVGSDATSDIALVNVPEDVPVAPFSDDTALASGAPDMALGYMSTGGAAVALHATPGSVTAVGTQSSACPDSGMAAITSSPGLAGQTGGEPLLDANGAIVGILCNPQPSGASPVAFLPTQLVVGVADEIRSGNKVVPGVLGVGGDDVPDGAGAHLMTVTNGSPAEGRLQTGEVIVAVDSLPVRTFAELRARLYVLSPGSLATLSVQGAPGATGTKLVGVTLGGSS
jgi:putative serine protease PepD